MRLLKTRKLMRKFVRLARFVHGYVVFYLFYHGWGSYVSVNNGKPRRVGRLTFCADPFLLEYGGASWLFYESIDKCGKGFIGCFKFDNGRWCDIGSVLAEPWHLSYPQVFVENGKVYMIPESCDFGKGDVCLYEATDFPRGWKKVAKLIDRPFADSTVLKHDGHWYMACYTIPPNESAELWHAPLLIGPWSRHPMWDKINQSNRLRRCGGSFIVEDGKLYRIAQDCNGMYGKRLFKVEVCELSPSAYKEGEAIVLLDRTSAPQGYKHTYNRMTLGKDVWHVVDVHEDFLEKPQVVFMNIAKALRKKFLRHG